jgi:5-methylcytosine-specific restriction endonuclease McrBC regulatory subunit McrC
MRQNLININPLVHIAIQHLADQINALVANRVRHAQVAVHDLVDAVEGVLLVDDGVQQDAQGPDVLLFAAVGLTCEDFGGGVI